MSVAVDWMRVNTRRQPRIFLSEGEIEPRKAAEATTPATITRSDELLPKWYMPVVERLVGLQRLRDNWDSYGAKTPSFTSAETMLQVLAAIMRVNSPAPSIVPSPLGHFQAEWHQDGIDLEVEVIAPAKISVSYEGPDGDWEDEVSFDFTRLVKAVGKIGRVP